MARHSLLVGLWKNLRNSKKDLDEEKNGKKDSKIFPVSRTLEELKERC
jgi:hypothetical protein